VHTRIASVPRAGSSGLASSAANSVGTPQKIVGWWRERRANTAAGVGRSAISTVVAPIASGNDSPLPSP
jgi:hypothetical protein